MSREDADLDRAGVQAWILLSMQLGRMLSEGLRFIRFVVEQKDNLLQQLHKNKHDSLKSS